MFQLCRDGPSWVEPVLSKDKCVLLRDTTQIFFAVICEQGQRAIILILTDIKTQQICFYQADYLIVEESQSSYYPHAFLKKGRGYCNRLRPSVCPSVCPSRYLLLNHWTKSNQIWCVCCSHEWGMQRHFFFWPRPLGP